MKRLHQRLLIGGLLAAAGLAAVAQSGPGAAPADAPQPTAKAPAARTAQDGRERMRQKMAERHAQRLSALKAKLQLKPEQEGAWNSFSAAMQPPARPDHRAEREALAKLSTPERVDRMNGLMAQRQEQMRQRGEASKAFYATLDDAQKKIFDQEMVQPRRHGHEHRS